MALPDNGKIKQIIEGDTKVLVEVAEELGKHLNKNELTTSQIRNVFGSVKKMEMRGFKEKELLLLKPKLAYAASRPGAKSKRGLSDLRSVLSTAIDFVGNNETYFENFCNFFEAILAYHRAAGGK